MSNEDQRWMTRALELAQRGRGGVEPNPLVGAVVVRDGQLVGEGWHERFGQAHAEVHALAAAGAAARGATLYVTLEPCCHHGKTPPCTDAVVRAGIARVVAAMTDPFAQVAGQGGARLHAAGVAYEVGLCEAEARRLNAPYLTLLQRGRPYVHAKWAMTLDGKIATRTGNSKWISSEASRRRVHELRGRMDAIVVGLGTVRADNPLLTARPPGPRTATRIVLDSLGRLPRECELVRSIQAAPVLVVVNPEAPPAHVTDLRSLGCEVLPLPGEGNYPSITALLRELGRRRMTNILVEGGAEVLGSCLDADLLDEVHVFLAPRLVGGSLAKGAIGGRGRDTLLEAMALTHWDVEEIEGDVYLHGWRTGP